MDKFFRLHVWRVPIFEPILAENGSICGVAESQFYRAYSSFWCAAHSVAHLPMWARQFIGANRIVVRRVEPGRLVVEEYDYGSVLDAIARRNT